MMSQRELQQLDEYIENRDYLPVGETLAFSLPEKKLINKSGSLRKRTVYIFPEKENMILKLLTWLLYKYDDAFHPSCYSFRKNHTARKAFQQITEIEGLGNKYVMKADIHDYFNSMPCDMLVSSLEEVITDDERLLDFLKDFFTVNKAVYEGEVIEENRGAMAGVPLSAFIANIYLSHLDELMCSLGVRYFRYSDDMILFADSQPQLTDCHRLMSEYIETKGLQLNEEKTQLLAPGQPWDFLGFRYDDGHIDISSSTLRKTKAKIRRKARALYRWQTKKDVSFEKTARVLIRRFNRKFYDLHQEYDFTWSRWFFPVITTDSSLRELDRYFLEYIRYLYSGRHYKGNYAVSYQDIKEMGYRSLVHEYHRFRDGESEIV